MIQRVHEEVEVAEGAIAPLETARPHHRLQFLARVGEVFHVLHVGQPAARHPHVERKQQPAHGRKKRARDAVETAPVRDGDQAVAARLEHAPHFVEGLGRIGQVFDERDRHNHFKARVAELQPFAVAHLESRAARADLPAVVGARSIMASLMSTPV